MSLNKNIFKNDFFKVHFLSKKNLKQVKSVISIILVMLLVLAMVIWTPWLLQAIFNFVSMMTALVVFCFIYFTIKMIKEAFKSDKD